ncbi:MAG: hypothetical protein LBT30_06250 [Clostridiales bacterium]|jgi:TrmH family RNA methyltransferase|nr:hypothetical protein [Clostridiales bacterium]
MENNIKEKLNLFVEHQTFEIIGEKNPKIKQIKGILSNTKANPQKLFIAEGLWIFNKLNDFHVETLSLFLCMEHIRTHEAFMALTKLSERTKEKYIISSKVFEKISERDKPDGLLAIAKLPTFKLEEQKFNNKSIILVLDGIEIPGNIGTMIRMADGTGIDAIFICNRRARLTHPKLIKGSMGAVLTVPIYEFSNIEECDAWLKLNKFKVYLADTRAEHTYYEEPFGSKTALVMGSERYGISRNWYTDDIFMISIPMLGKCDSLNVGVAATVLAYEVAMKNKFILERKK